MPTPRHVDFSNSPETGSGTSPSDLLFTALANDPSNISFGVVSDKAHYDSAPILPPPPMTPNVDLSGLDMLLGIMTPQELPNDITKGKNGQHGQQVGNSSSTLFEQLDDVLAARSEIPCSPTPLQALDKANPSSHLSTTVPFSDSVGTSATTMVKSEHRQGLQVASPGRAPEYSAEDHSLFDSIGIDCVQDATPFGYTLSNANPLTDITRKRKATVDDVKWLRKLRIPRCAFNRTLLEAWSSELDDKEAIINRREQKLRKITVHKQQLLQRAIPDDIAPLQSVVQALQPYLRSLTALKAKESSQAGQLWITTSEGAKIYTRVAIKSIVKFFRCAEQQLSAAVEAPLRNACLSTIVQSLSICKYVIECVHIVGDLDLPCDYDALLSAHLGRIRSTLLPGLPDEARHLFSMKMWLVYVCRQLLIMLHIPTLHLPSEELRPVISSVTDSLYNHKSIKSQKAKQTSYCSGKNEGATTMASKLNMYGCHNSEPSTAQLPLLVELSTYHNLPDLIPFSYLHSGCAVAAVERFESHLR